MNCFCITGENKSSNTQNPTTITAVASTSGTAAALTSGTALASTSGTAAASTSTPKRKGKFKFKLNKVKKDGSSAVQIREFSFNELKAATKDFKPKNILGEGGFGTVYKGKLSPNKQVVAIKQLDPEGRQGTREFTNEVKILRNAKHENIIQLIGYCDEEKHMLLVYEYMPLGSLEDHLFDRPKDKKPQILDWNTRMKIAFETAKGLEYLHNKLDPPLIYRDLKCSNILLGDGYNVKLSDFGITILAPTGDQTHVLTKVIGTRGYCAQEYAEGYLTFKSDIYSFGVVLLELITGRKAFDITKPFSEQELVLWARPKLSDMNKVKEIVDPLLQDQYSNQGLNTIIAVAALCVQEDFIDRPEIGQVVEALDYITSHPYIPQTGEAESSRVSHFPRLRKGMHKVLQLHKKENK